MTLSTRILLLCLIACVSFGCATNPALLTDAQRSEAGIMSHRAEQRMAANRIKKPVIITPAPISWIDRTYARNGK